MLGLAGTQAILRLRALALGAVRDDLRAHGVEQRRDPAQQRVGVAAGPVRDADHADEPIAVREGDACEAVQRRMAVGQSAGARIARRFVGDHDLPRADRGAEQRVEVAELESLRRVALEERPAGVVPGDVGDRVGLQVGGAVVVAQDLADEAVLAGGEPQDRFQQRIEGLRCVGAGQEEFLDPRHRREHAARVLELRLG